MPKSIDFENLTFKELEWIGLMIAMGYTFLKSELLYENTGFQRYIYITFVTFMLFIYSLKMVGVFNIFKLTRNFPTYVIKYSKYAWQYLIDDYKYWKINKQRKQYD